MLHSADELAALVNELGFLPFFAGQVRGFSVEECTPADRWFVDGTDGPWEWKGPAIQAAGCAYGKFFKGKAGYISRDWYPDFANVRRSGLSFAEAYGDGRIPHDTKAVYDTLAAADTLLSRDLKRRSGCPKKSFDSVLTRLQMQGYVVTTDFEYARDRFGKPYGWGLARVDIPEHVFEANFMDEVSENTPTESRQKLLTHLARLWPSATEKQQLRLIDL